MRQDMQAMKTPKMSATKLTTNPDIDYDRLLEMSNQTLGTPMVPPVGQDQLDSASDMRDLGSLAAALSGAVRGAGSLGGKLPNDFGFDQIARDMGNSRSVDLQNRMALRKQQENDMLEAIKNTGIAAQAKAKAERRVKTLSPTDRQIANSRLKQFDAQIPDLPAEMTYGDLEEEPFLAQVLGIDNNTSGMSEYQKIMTDLRATEVRNNADLRGRGLGIQGVTASTAVDAAAAKEADRIAEIERKKAFISPTELEVIHKGLKKQGYTNLPKSLTRGDVEKSRLYTSILSGAVSTTNQDATQGRLKEKDAGTGGSKPLTEAQKLKAMENLTNNLGKGGYAEAWGAMNKLQSLLAKYENKKIPGVGAGGKFNLKAAYERYSDEDAAEIERTAGTLANIKIKDRSGAAVTVPEFERLKVELGQGFTADAGKFRRAMKAAHDTLIIRTKDQIAPYKSNGVYTEWIGSGEGTDYEQYLPGGSQSTQPGTSTDGSKTQGNIPKGALDSATDNYNSMMGDKAPKATPSPPTKLNAKDQELFDWAQKNQNDPKAQQVMKIIQRKLGTK